VSEAAAVLITGAYGTGKSTVTEEMAERLEAADAPYAAIDLDWLIWANVPDADGGGGLRVFLQNLAAVVGNYRAAGMTRFVLAGWVSGMDEIDRIRASVEMPLAVVRLDAPIEVIERRLQPNPTDARRKDLEIARREIAAGHFDDLGDIVIDSARPVGEVAGEILAWLGWLRRSGSSDAAG
jgi:thymidylate kinase